MRRKKLETKPRNPLDSRETSAASSPHPERLENLLQNPQLSPLVQAIMQHRKQRTLKRRQQRERLKQSWLRKAGLRLARLCGRIFRQRHAPK